MHSARTMLQSQWSAAGVCAQPLQPSGASDMAYADQSCSRHSCNMVPSTTGGASEAMVASGDAVAQLASGHWTPHEHDSQQPHAAAQALAVRHAAAAASHPVQLRTAAALAHGRLLGPQATLAHGWGFPVNDSIKRRCCSWDEQGPLASSLARAHDAHDDQCVVVSARLRCLDARSPCSSRCCLHTLHMSPGWDANSAARCRAHALAVRATPAA